MMSVNLVNCLVVMIWVDLHRREQNILDISTKPSIQRIGNQSDHPNPITFHNYFDENGFDHHFNSTLPGFHYEFKVFFTDLNIFYQIRLAGLTKVCACATWLERFKVQLL